METWTNFLLEINNKTAYLTVNRPEKLNALNRATLTELASILQQLQADEDVRGIILTGAGERAFVAGADIREFDGLSPEGAHELAAWGHREIMDVLYHFPKPVVAAINGFALGGGLELALACHLRIASVDAKMGLPEVSLGLIPGYGGTQRLPQLVGRGKALEMILTGDMVDAETALQWGLVNHVVPADELIPKCEELLNKMYSRSSTALMAAINTVNTGLRAPELGYPAEIEAFAHAFTTPDFKEGVRAFLEKRKPNF
ncbi:enoyl-CoA hydratase [Sphingobacterium allocomposti]|uniref:Enoyl-CoA hydratase n=1 Tax=Sphingobacterium allocomposti TaxID=415956 RepID=A0A5S5DRX7_9SPHI|nr:enoyl-CoA hydratase-related protein [Sphingobacterium composti Yoo et al. 2007 non Ten et al. 2007]TYP98680.1 enoyl-CoA hydratase [Sphingobacterium composti Yoo et al. 2007 non Ten et al. 2007]